MRINKYGLFAATIAIPALIAMPNIIQAKEYKPFYKLNSLENDTWKNVSDQQIYDWLYDNGITTSRDLAGPVQFWFTFGSLADYLSKTGVLDLPETTYYTTDEIGFYSAYCWEIRKIYDKLNHQLPTEWLTHKDLAILLPEIFPQYKGLNEAQVLQETGVLKNKSYNPDKKLYQYEAGRAIYYAVHTMKSKTIPTSEKYITNFSYIPIQNPEITENKPAKDTSIVDFSDVPKNSNYYTIIQEMRQRNIINGYNDGTFRPTANISRQHASAMIIRYANMLSPYKTPAIKFADINEESEYYKPMIEMQRRKIFIPDSTNNISPTKQITRGEVAAALINLLNLDSVNLDTKNENYTFYDIKTSPYRTEIEAAYRAGIVTGYSNGRFKPTDPISRQHFSAMMSRAIEYKENKMLKLHQNTKLYNYSPTELPDLTIKLDYGMNLTDYTQILTDELQIARHQVISIGVGSRSIYENKNISIREQILAAFNNTKLTEEQTIQAFNYIYYTGKTLIINNNAFQYRHASRSLHRVSGFNN